MPQPVLSHIPKAGSVLRAAALVAAWALPFGQALAQDRAAEVPVASGPVITSIQQYWDTPPEQKARPCAFRIECDVTYYDSVWKILFVQDAHGDGAYVPSAKLTFPFKAGQHLVAEGLFVPPGADISFDHATITLVGASAPVPKSSAGRFAEAGELLNKYITAEGFVDRYSRMDAHHLRVTLSIEGGTAIAWILIAPDAPIPDLADATVRIEGIYNPKMGPDGKVSSFEILVPGMDRLTVLNRQDDDPRFKLPVVPIDSLPRQPRGHLVHVLGTAKGQEPGHWLRIRDASGQVDVMTGQLRACPDDESVEAVGYPLVTGAQLLLTDGLFRIQAAPNSGPAATPDATLRLAAQVIELGQENAKEGRPVWLTGVVTWSRKDAPFFFLQDSSGGVCVMRGSSSSKISGPGTKIEVHGVTGEGRFAPVVVASRFDKVSDLVLPVASPVTLEHALTGAEEAKWVEMGGYLRRVRPRGGWNYMELVTSSGDFVAVLPPGEDVSGLVGSVVVVRGVCTAETNEERKLIGIKLWTPSADYVQVVEARPKDPFGVTARSIASLGQYDSAQSFNRLLLVSGVVLNYSPGRFIQIENSGETLLVFSQGEEPLVPGDRIEVVGLLGRQGAHVTLREAIYRKSGHGDQPSPRRVAVGDTPSPDDDGHLVSIEGRLIASSTTGDQFRLTLQCGKAIFEAFLDQAAARGMPPDLTSGSLLSLTGVYTVKFDGYGRPSAHQLNLRGPEDIAVLQRPSWLTRGRILTLAGALALGILLFIAWVAALRRQVSEQTEQIREQVKRESRLEAELQRAGRLESLGLLAGGIAHDFNNLLTVVMGNLSLARLDTKMEPESESSLRDAEKAAARAKDLTQQLLTFAKGGAPIQTAVLLPDVVREVAQFALRGSRVRCEFDIPRGLWPANVDKGQIAQVVQNIVINAMQAMPEGGVIDISMRNETVGAELSQVLAPGDYLQIAFTDHGCGIPPENLGRIFDPYFTTKKHGSGLGLATVHSIVKKHLGHISTESTPGQGTTFRVWLPAAHGASAGGGDIGSRAPMGAGEARPRILFMDDEQAIQQLGGSILRRIGYDVTVASDGAEAVREYGEAMRAGRPYSAVILDLTIPGGMGGGKALEQLLKLDPEVKAIVSSGYSNDTVLSNYQAYGFRGMVSKPYETADLALAVESVLKGGRA